MTPQEINKKVDEFKDHCREEGHRITKQKEAIYRILLSDPSHPRAEDIYVKLKKSCPKASFATVYDNLRKLKALNLIREVNCGEGCSRFEANMQPHHHLIDQEKGTITDIHLNETQAIPVPDELKHLNIKEINVNYVV